MMHWLDSRVGADDFPAPEQALACPEGLLAAGGDLSPERLLAAYRRGIFPWYEEGQPILWWCPDPRAVLFPDELHISRSLRRTLRSGRFLVSVDRCFSDVIVACSRRDEPGGTWITDEMVTAYTRLHELGHAHSIEVWHADRLAGGLYGVRLGGVFFGESMFSRLDNASKVAMVHLRDHGRKRGLALIDCQLPSPHLASMGSRSIPRPDFLAQLARHCSSDAGSLAWQHEPRPIEAPA